MRPLPPDRRSRLGLPPHLTRSRAWKLRQYLPHLHAPGGVRLSWLASAGAPQCGHWSSSIAKGPLQ